jgi:hypothetical protein
VISHNGTSILPKGDAIVKQILDDSNVKEAAVTIAAVQPTVMADRESGELHHSSSGRDNYNEMANGGWGILFRAKEPRGD